MNLIRESIFVSAFRALFTAFGVIIGIILAIFVAVLGIGLISNNVSIPDKSTLTVSADTNGERKLLPSTAPVILRIDVHGIIGQGNGSSKYFSDMLLDSQAGVLEKHRVKGILLHMNTPGGYATDSADIYRMILDYKKKYNVPVYTYVDGLCASGGMYIAAASDKIFATEDSVIGSVGIRMGPTFNVVQAMDKLGIQALTLTEGKDKDMLNPFRPWKEDESATLQKILVAEYEQFVNVVAAARPKLTRDKLVSEFGAHVFVAKQAEELGYIDRSGSDYNSALKELTAAAGIKDDEKYQVLLIEPYQSALKSLAQSRETLLTGKIKHVFPLGPYMTTEMSGKLLYLYQP